MQDGSAIYVMQHVVVLIRLIWKPPVIEENVVETLTLSGFWSNPNRGILIKTGRLCAIHGQFNAWLSANKMIRGNVH